MKERVVKMKVENMTSSRGNDVPNQFIISGLSSQHFIDDTKTGSGTMFQSYVSNIAFREYTGKIYLDKNKWDYSVTTGRYRNQFLGETKKETQAKIDSGEYKLVDLN